MANAHRIAWIDAQIRAGRHPNATDARSAMSALLSCRSEFEVLAPNWLRDRVVRRLEALLVAHTGD